MQSNENLRNEPSAPARKAYIANFIMLFALVVCIILVILAWYMNNENGYMHGLSFISNDTINVTYSTYVGTVTSTGAVEFDESKDISADSTQTSAVTIFPGQKQYYKTVVKNGELQSFTGTLYLESLYVNKNFASYVTTDGSTVSYVQFTSYLGTQSSTTQTYDLSSSSTIFDSTYYNVSSQSLYSGITLPAGTGTTGDVTPSMVTIVWCVQLDGDKVTNFDAEGNSVMDTPLMKFNGIRFRQEAG